MGNIPAAKIAQEQLPHWQNFDELVAVHQTQLAAFQVA